VSVLALVVAMAGTAFSGGGSAVPGKNGVLSSDIKNKQVKAKDLAKIATRSETSSIEGEVADNGLFGGQTVSVDCKAKEKVLSGGVEILSDEASDDPPDHSVFNHFVGDSHKSGNGWKATVATDEGEVDYRVYAYCLK
jgi:hypothetical protein